MDPIFVNPIRKRINKIFDSHILTDNSEALNTISGLCTSNSSNTRRMLVNEIEKRDMLVNKTISIEYNKVSEKLQVLLDSLNALDSSVRDMSKKLNDSKTKTHHLISQTTKLKDERKKTEKKLVWVDAFVKNFNISPEQNEYIYNVSVKTPLTSDFFGTLAQIEKLNDNCKTLVKCWYQTSAFDIMEITGIQQEVAIEKLYHWTIGACRSIDSPNNALVPRALAKLQNRQVLFSNILDEYCTARKATIVQLFIDALTKGADSGSKPIEFYANDAKRYIGDILTWVYQIIPIEKENLAILLKDCDLPDKNDQITQALTTITEALCPLLKVRAELILKPDKDPLVLWSISNLINYYKEVIQAVMPKGHLIDTFTELLQKSEEVFVITLDSKIQRELSHGVKAPPSDLNPSVVVTNLVGFLRDLLAIMNSTHNINNVDKKIITTHILDPLLHAINETACHLSSSDMSVYTLNCIYHIQCTLSLHTIMDEYNERLQAQSEAQIDTLTSEQASFLVANLNLGPIYTILQEKTSGPISAIPGMDTATLKMFLSKFDMFIVSPEVYTLPQLNLLLSHNHKLFVMKRSFEVILAIYGQLYQAVFDPMNGYVNPQDIVKRTPEEVNKLLT
ncbi:conserved oligomeric Golgi complex subunit 6 [Leguminivora glycinivorella]|uniref:conserved oligomeric Golgi complex subunit 6 n=1 Tax=Leguminivora glycinivorella TaxID=1035111 RepID=UPI00200D54BE|nr:conserved oligomeric Golgi complex subunit 6 [Leguminivora glycinivorella]